MPKYLLFCGFFFLASNLLAQDRIQTKNILDVEDLVKEVFIKGNCKNVRNIRAIGDQDISIGQFENGDNNIGISDGIILSTGDIDLAQGPNIHIDASYSFDAESEDADLSLLATTTLYDITGIEFDFVPLNDRVTFRYVFASEEYCEFVGTSFNDVFGFFVSGPGINGSFDNNAINVANVIALDGTDVNVSINNINHATNETFYVSNITTTDAQNCSIEYDPSFQDLIEYDGFTIPLRASFSVIPCETYRIRLVIGDVGDPNLDSAVFLGSNSFDLGQSIEMRAEVLGTYEPIAYEGCRDGQFVFTRNSSSNINNDLIIDYDINPLSSAINGVDFEEIPLSITIPAGENSVTLPIRIIEDNVLEGPENLKLELFYNCDCIDPTRSELIIDDSPEELNIFFDNTLVCDDQLFSIAPNVTGGVPPYDFLWENGVDTSIIEDRVSEPTEYSITVTDFCDNVSSAIANVDIQNVPSAILNGSYEFCEISETGLPITLEGSPPWAIEYSIDGDEQILIENIESNPFYLDVAREGFYELVSFRDANCDGIASGSAEIESSFSIDTKIIHPTCTTSANGSIQILQIDALAPLTLEWNVATQDEYLLEGLSEGIYTLSITNGNGCAYEKSYQLIADAENTGACTPFFIPNVFSPNGDGINDVFTIFFEEPSQRVTVNSFQIFNRWGELIFERKDFTSDSGLQGWDGTYKGRSLESNVFFYKITIALEAAKTQLITGDITLIK